MFKAYLGLVLLGEGETEQEAIRVSVKEYIDIVGAATSSEEINQMINRLEIEEI